jgi:hypothetical protein
MPIQIYPPFKSYGKTARRYEDTPFCPKIRRLGLFYFVLSVNGLFMDGQKILKNNIISFPFFPQ